MDAQEKFRVFVFSKTAAYRHDSIPAGIEALRQLGASSGAFAVEASEDASLIEAASLSRFKVVLFLSTSGEFLTAEQLGGLRAYVNNGGGFVGVHCAAAGMRSAPWYGELVGAYFAGHAAPRRGVVAVEGGGHAVASGLPDAAFEWFDESLYEGGGAAATGSDRPLAWCREFDGGRSFYTALGHFDAAFRDRVFMTHLLNGILWAARVI